VPSIKSAPAKAHSAAISKRRKPVLIVQILPRFVFGTPAPLVRARRDTALRVTDASRRSQAATGVNDDACIGKPSESPTARVA
jgi:hypothetical protein